MLARREPAAGRGTSLYRNAAGPQRRRSTRHRYQPDAWRDISL